MAVKHATDGDDGDGWCFGQSADEKIALWGGTPVVRPSGASQGAITDNSGGTANLSTGVAAVAARQTIIIPLQLKEIADAATYKIKLPFAHTVVSALFRTGDPATTSAKATTLTLSTTAGAVTGGVMALTSANQTPAGATVAATAISGANATNAADGEIIITASSTTAFAEGDGYLEIVVTNLSLANAIATIIAHAAAVRTALVALNAMKGAA